MGVITGLSRSATIKAKRDVVLLEIQKLRLDKLMKDDIDVERKLYRNMLRSLCEKLRSTSSEMAEGATKTDREIMALLGARLRALRKARRLTLKEVAAATDLARRTVARAEKGDNPQLETLLRLLRAYGRLEALDGFIPEPELSPMALLKERGRRKPRG